MPRKAFVIVCLFAVAVLCSCSLLPTEEELLAPPVLKSYNSVQYSTFRVARGDLLRFENITVSYIPTVTQTLFFAVSGYSIIALNCNVGDPVRAGDVLGVLDTSDLDGPLDDVNRQISNNQEDIENCRALYEIDRQIASYTNSSEQVRAAYTVACVPQADGDAHDVIGPLAEGLRGEVAHVEFEGAVKFRRLENELRVRAGRNRRAG